MIYIIPVKKLLSSGNKLYFNFITVFIFYSIYYIKFLKKLFNYYLFKFQMKNIILLSLNLCFISYYLYIFLNKKKIEEIDMGNKFETTGEIIKYFEKPTSMISSILKENKNSKIKKVSSIEFSTNEKKWKYLNQNSDLEKSPLSTSTIEDQSHNLLSFITYNIWFDPHNWDNRVREILKILQKYSPSFICLQEVTNKFLNNLLQDENIKNNYIISANNVHQYDVLILYNKNYLKNSSVQFYSLDYPSRMGRKLLLAEVIRKVGDKYQTILIGTSHFESLYPNSKFRQQQLSEAFKILDTNHFSFLMGDFNFDPIFNHDEEKNINATKYQDSWLKYVEMKNSKGEEAKGLTFPQEDDIPPTRLDRLYYSKNSGIQLLDFEIIGQKEIDVDKRQVNNWNINTPSDHKGLYVKFEIK
jgi:tyrosyl-DNA phosphodiesterase 2